MANINRYNEKREDMIKTRRIKAGLEERQDEEREYRVPTTMKGLWENFLYHYKKIMIVVVILIITVVACVASFLVRPTYDLSLIVVSERSFAGASGLFSPSLRGFASDVNGDGNVQVEFLSYEVTGNGEQATDMTNMTFAQMIGRLSETRDFLFLLDEAGYENLKSVGVSFVDIAEFAGGENIEGDRYQLKGKYFCKKVGLDGGLDDMFLCFLDMDGYVDSTKNNANVLKIHDAQKEMFEKILAYE